MASGKISFRFLQWHLGARGEVAYNEGSGTGGLDSDLSAVLLASAGLTLQHLACLVPGCYSPFEHPANFYY